MFLAECVCFGVAAFAAFVPFADAAAAAAAAAADVVEDDEVPFFTVPELFRGCQLLLYGLARALEQV